MMHIIRQQRSIRRTMEIIRDRQYDDSMEGGKRQ